MSNTIRIKRRASGGTGAPASLQNAELAFNEVGDVLYYGKGTGGAGGSATTVEPIGGKGAFVDLSSTQNVGGAKTFTGAVTFSGTIVVPAPTTGSHAVTKDYVDSLVSGGVVWLAAVRAATTANITLSGTQTIDGIALGVGDRVLVKDQTTGSQNGIYVVASGSWTRATDFDTASQAEISTGKSVFTSDGTTNGGTQWTLSTTGTITVGTTALSFIQIGGGQNDTGKNVGDEGVGLFIQKVGKELELRKLTAESGSGISVDTPAGLNGSARINVSTIPVAKGGTGATDAATARTNLGLAIGTNIQAYDADLAAIAALSGTSGFLKKTAADTWSLDTGSYQVSDATLTALAGVTTAANKLIYATGADAFTTTDLSSFGRTLIDDADAAAARTTLGLGTAATQASTAFQASDATLTALAGVTVAADQVIYSTGADAFAVAALTSFGRSLIDDADAAAARTTLGLGTAATQPSTAFQAADADLTAIAALAGTSGFLKKTAADTWSLDTATYLTSVGTTNITNAAVTYAKIQNVSATDRILGRFSAGAGVVEEITCTAAGRALIDDADASAQRSTLGLGSMATQAANNVSITGGTLSGVTIDGGTF